MDLRDFIDVVARRWILIVVATIVTIGGVLIFSTLQTPVYEAKATCVISPTAKGADELAAIQVIDKLLKTINQIAVSRPVLDGAKQRLGGKAGTGQLDNSVHSEVLIDTQIITISAKDKKPETAALKANAVADSLVDFVNGESGDTSSYEMEKLESAMTPKSPVSPKTVINAIIGGIIGLLIGIAVAIILEHGSSWLNGKHR